MNTLRYTLLPMLAAMAAAVGTMMLATRRLEPALGQYPGMMVSVLLSCAAYVLVTRLIKRAP